MMDLDKSYAIARANAGLFAIPRYTALGWVDTGRLRLLGVKPILRWRWP